MPGGKQLGEVPGYVREVGLAQQFAYDSSNRMEYQGFAYPGAATSDSKWAIRKFTYVSAGNGIGNTATITWAGGNDGFTNVWDSRTGYTYS